MRFAHGALFLPDSTGSSHQVRWTTRKKWLPLLDPSLERVAVMQACELPQSRRLARRRLEQARRIQSSSRGSICGHPLFHRELFQERSIELTEFSRHLFTGSKLPSGSSARKETLCRAPRAKYAK